MVLATPLGDFSLVHLLVVKACCRVTVSMLWEFEREGGTSARGRRDADGPVVRADDRGHDGQAEAGPAGRAVAPPAAGRIAPVEPFEDPAGLHRVDPVAVVAHLQR